MRIKGLCLVILLSLICLLHGVQAQTYLTQPITAQNAAALAPLMTWDHSLPLDAPYDVSPEPTVWPNYSPNPNRTAFEPDFIFSPDGRYLAHIIDEPLTLWLVDLLEGTERAFPLDAENITISPDWRTLVLTKQDASSSRLVLHLWDMDSLLALPRAPIGATVYGECQFRVTISSTNLRLAPQVESTSLGYALADQLYPVIATTLTGDWVQVHGETQAAWLSSQYGTLEGDCTAPPIYLTDGGEKAVIHDREVMFSPDNRILFTNSSVDWSYRYNVLGHATVSAYRVDSNSLLYELDVLLPLDFSPDNRLMADRWGRFFEVETGRLVFSLVEQVNTYGQNREFGIGFSPDGSKVAILAGDGVVRLLDTSDWREVNTFTPLGTGIGIEFSPDGRYLLVKASSPSRDSSQSEQVFMWDLLNTQTHVLTERDADTGAFILLPEGVGTRYPESFLRDGSGILPASYESWWVTVWDVAARDFRFKVRKPNTNDSVALTPYSDTLRVRSAYNEDARLIFINAHTGDMLADVYVPYFYTFSPDWRWILAQNENSITVWGVPENAVVPTLPPTVTRTPTPTITPTPPGFVPTAYPTIIGEAERRDLELAISLMSATPLLTATASPTLLPTVTPFIVTPQPGAEAITAANYESVTLLNTLQFPEPARTYYRLTKLTPDGGRLVMTSERSLIVRDVLRGDVLLTFDEHPERIMDMVISRDGRYVLTAADDRTARLWELDTGRLVHTVNLDSNANGGFPIRLSPDNTRMMLIEYTGDRTYRLRIRDIATGEIVLETGSSMITGGGFRPDGVAVWWSDSVVHSGSSTSQYGYSMLYEIWRATSEATVVPSSDYTRLAVFNNQRVNIHIWDTSGGKEPLLLQGHTAPVQAVYFSPDSRLLISIDTQDNLLMWDAATGERLTAIPDGMLPNGMAVGGSRWLTDVEDGQPLVMNVSTFSSLIAPGRDSTLNISADGTTLVLTGHFAYVFGVPTATRPAYAGVPARVVPVGINVRPEPSLDAAPSGVVSQGMVVVAGRDASGQFVYLPGANGWVLADPAYIDLGDLTLEQLPIREPGE